MHRMANRPFPPRPAGASMAYQYDDVFNVHFPESWHIRYEDSILLATSPDHSATLAFWISSDAADYKTVLRDIAGLTHELFRPDEQSVSPMDKMNINQLTLAFVEGKGKARRTDVDFSLGVLTPDGSTLITMLCYGQPEPLALHSDSIEQIIRSIHPIAQR